MYDHGDRGADCGCHADRGHAIIHGTRWQLRRCRSKGGSVHVSSNLVRSDQARSSITVALFLRVSVADAKQSPDSVRDEPVHR